MQKVKRFLRVTESCLELMFVASQWGKIGENIDID